jgi:hypothetical protein
MVTVSLVPGFTSYAEWFGPSGLDILTTMSSQYASQSVPTDAWSNLANVIMTALVPINSTLELFGNFTLSDEGYTRFKELFVQLCSYRVVFLDSERDIPGRMIGGKWSNKYGPDTAESNANIIQIVGIEHTDATVFNGDLPTENNVEVSFAHTTNDHVYGTYTSTVTDTGVSVTENISLFQGTTVSGLGPSLSPGGIYLPVQSFYLDMIDPNG